MHKKRIAMIAVGLMLTGGLGNVSTITSHAEKVPGYHEYVNNEDEAIDTWYGIARGTYLRDGTTGIRRAGTCLVNISGTTTAHSKCDYVKVGIYLDESSDGGSHFGNIAKYHFQEQQTTSCHGSKANISVTKGYKYRVRGVHSVVKGSTVETTDTKAGVLTAS
ncbi:DUF6147 family protein [Candidatus Merdisoma sp. HCP28S3_D10]|uniref:DUF6147 family protein n=1 Tax=unclassified Candidatus Merdisoma TaxID=3099611 RepID=UPI003F899630